MPRIYTFQICLFTIQWTIKFHIPSTVQGKNSPEKKPPDSKPNPIPNLTFTLPLTLTGGFFPGDFFLTLLLHVSSKFAPTTDRLLALCFSNRPFSR